MPHTCSRPHFAISSLSSPLLGIEELNTIASGWRFDGLDVDLTHWLRRRSPAKLATLGTERRNPIQSIWVAPKQLSNADRSLNLTNPLGNLLLGASGLTIVVPDAGDALGERLRGERFEFAAKLQAELSDRHRVAIGVRAVTRAAGRSHLVRLRALRSMTEEWSLGLALDLHSADDWQWEAEAAVFHAASNLDLIRVALPGSSFDAHVRSRLTARTLAAAVDAGFCGIYALAPHLPVWHWRNRNVFEALCGEGRERIVTMMRGESDAIIRSDFPSWTRQ